jgi:acetyltransferase-like isoleucine patch superfamily enzyme
MRYRRTTLIFIHSLLRGMVGFLLSLWRLSRYQKDNPTCRLFQGVMVDTETRLGRFNVVFPQARIFRSTLGDHTYVQNGAILLEADIGRFCSIASGVRVGLGRHPTFMVSTHPAFYSRTQPIEKTFSSTDTFISLKKTTIGHDVWIGMNALISDGVTIGTGAIIAAGAVVTKDVAPYAIVGGVPAKVIRYRFDELIIDRLLKSQWWNMSEQDLTERAPYFGNPLRMLEIKEKELNRE